MTQQVLVVGSLGYKGSRITKFLKQHDCFVFGVDRYGNEDENYADRFLKIDLRHRASADFLSTVFHPDVIIFCWEGVNPQVEISNVDYAFVTYYQVLAQLIGENTSKLVLCVDEVKEAPVKLFELNQTILACLQDIYALEYDIDSYVISDQENLLKSIKKIITGGGEEINDKAIETVVS